MLVTDVIIGDHPTLPRILNTQKNGRMYLTKEGIKLENGTVLTMALVRSFRPIPEPPKELPVAEEKPKPRRKAPARRSRKKARPARED